ncbi:hypothetical protein [Streptomyces sp.]|uniref:hypothetical protein n=1 Tax=Streptomyces sp. TaxID=1931 RepID=UPI002F422F55
MPITVPTKADIQALHDFLQARNEDEWQAALADPDISERQHEAVRRLTNSHKITLASTTTYLLVCLDNSQTEQAATLWNFFTNCGEQWEEHPDWRPAWANPARAALMADLTAGRD